MTKTNDQITNLDAELDALSSPTTADTYVVSKDYDPDVVAASAARRALGGGGGGGSNTLDEVLAVGNVATVTGSAGTAIAIQSSDSPGGDLLKLGLVGGGGAVMIPTGASFVVASEEEELSFNPIEVGSDNIAINLNPDLGTSFEIDDGTGKVLRCGWNHTSEIMVGRSGGRVGFYGTEGVVLQTGVAVTAEAIHAALVNLGIITA